MSFSKMLKTLRKEYGFTQKQVADGIDVTEQSYQRFEYGTVKPGFDKLIALANFFDVPLDYLVGRGIFQNWDLVMKHKDRVVDAIVEAFDSINFPLMPKSFILSLSERNFVEVFRGLVKHIDIQENGERVDIFIDILPLDKIFPEYR